MAYNNYSGVPLGTQISPANSAGAGQTTLDAAVSGTDAAAIASNEQMIHGRNSLKVTSGATAANNQLGWNAATLGTGDTMYLQTYLYVPALPAANITLFRCTADGTGTLCGALVLLTSGLIRWTNNTGATIASGTTTTVINTGQWIRVQGKIKSSGTAGQVETKLYNNSALESTTPTETVTSGSAEVTGAGTVNTIRYTQTNNLSNSGPIYWADTDVNLTGYAAPIGSTDIWTYSRFGRFG